MINFLKSKFRKSNIDQNLYDWKYFDVTELKQFPDVIGDIYNKKYVGVIIKNVFSEMEVLSMKNGAEGMDTSTMISTGVGYSYPRIFAQLVRPHDGSSVTETEIRNYFTDCEKLPDVLSNILGVDFKNRIEKIFNEISAGRIVSVPKGCNGEGNYAMGSVRINQGGKGFIPVHCGNYFQQEYPLFYNHLKTQIQVEDQLSYFVTVSAAEEGGELTLFDLLWESGQFKENVGSDLGINLPNGEFVDTTENSKLKRQKVKPGPGDLLIFSGGPVWHKVELVKGKTNRITIGGFIAVTEDDQHLKYWT